ncbi:DinB family protein [Microlunatus elymi]|uniref:DinB family protein n=1 Tax=Microlunatus elymi TaxID=2596828 RepID=A0A516Q578_9ACTN|nr:DinB family protein [Microlunatus elymi]QDP98371.1 DinB family protein [Microlunatus elymi]
MIIPEALPAPNGTDPERAVLEGFLEQYRAIAVRKAAGLDEAAARRRLVDSPTTVAGLIKHLRWVEEAWFVEVLQGRPRPQWRDVDPDWQFRLEDDDQLGNLIAEFQQACQRSRLIAAEHDLDDTGSHPRLGVVSLRWIYAHMIEEIARHAGQLDILREQLDGVVGFD